MRRIAGGGASGSTKRATIIDELFSRLAEGAQDGAALEREFTARLDSAGSRCDTASLLEARASLIARQVAPFMVGNSTLDLGCGDALASGALCGDDCLVLADVMDYRDPSQHDRDFRALREGRRLPFPSRAFDTVLLLTVLHHARDPQFLIAEARRVCRRRVVVIESVFGVRASVRLRPLRTNPSALSRQVGIRPFLQLSRQEQLAYCAFVDWFYNRILHDEVPVPYCYNTPAGWRRVFREMGLREVAFHHLGLDQPVVPEFHTLHVLDVD